MLDSVFMFFYPILGQGRQYLPRKIVARMRKIP